MTFNVNGTATFDVAAIVEVPEGMTVGDYCRSDAGKKFLYDAFQEYWDNTSIKFRDAELVASSASQVLDRDNEGETILFGKVSVI